MFTRVISLSVLVSCSVLKKYFCNHFFIVLYYEAFQPINSKCIKKKVSPRFSVENNPPVRAVFIRAISVCYDKWIFSFFSEIIVLWPINLLMWFARKTPTKLSFMSGLLISFRAFSNWKLLIPLLILTNFLWYFWTFLICINCYVQFKSFFRFLFLIFDVPNLYSSETCLITSSASFFANSEFNALTPTPNPFFNIPVDIRAFEPNLAMFPKRLPPCCVLRFLCLFGPICPVLVMVTFRGRFFLIILSYLARKDCPFGNVTGCGVTHRLNNIFCPGALAVMASFFPTKYFFCYRAS